MEYDKKLIELYNLGEKEDIEFININLGHNKGLTRRDEGISFIILSLKLKGKEEYLVLCHEMGHYYKDCRTKLAVPASKAIEEARADKWKAQYLIPREKYIEIMHSPYVGNDWEAAEELGVDMDSIVCIHDVFRAQGLSVSQADLGCVMREP